MLYLTEFLSLPDKLVVHRNGFQVFLQFIVIMDIFPNIIASPSFLNLEEINFCLVYFKGKVCVHIKYVFYFPNNMVSLQVEAPICFN